LLTATTFRRKYIVLSNGQLLILNVNYNDLQRRFRCQVAKQFTGERIDSTNWAQLILIGRFYLQTTDHSMFKHFACHPTFLEHPEVPSSPQLPDKLDLETGIIIEEGESFLFHCPFQGWPEPQVTWHFANGPNIKSLSESKFIKIVSSLLYFSRFTFKDSGKYICSASNSHGQGQYEIELITKSKLTLYTSNVQGQTLTITKNNFNFRFI